MQTPKILFFIASAVATEDEFKAALEIGPVAMRNASLVASTDHPERRVDAVAGDEKIIPPQYKDYKRVKSMTDLLKIMRDKQAAENVERASGWDTAITDPPAQETPGAQTPGGKGGNKGGAWKANA